MRTTSQEHHNAVEHVWVRNSLFALPICPLTDPQRTLNDKGLIYKSTYSGWYAITDECFYPESSVVIDPATPGVAESKETGAKCEWASETNYMFRLSSFREPLLAYYRANTDSIFPDLHYKHVIKMLDNGALEDLSISRPRERLSWGVQVPGDPEQTVYVWFDALLVYLSGVGFPWPGGSKDVPWPANLQIIGKDILRLVI
jgi:methionyl-tRNA synthetase